MAQLFGPKADTRFRLGLLFAAMAVGVVIVVGFLQVRSDRAWNVGRPAEQPIPFRHDLHAGELGIDCRYCHSTVERAAFAGMPSAETCMTCHSQVWTGASTLEPLRSSLALDQPIAWVSVHRLPEHAYFHHAAHLASGVACETCHGQVWTMPRTVKAEPLSMGWCLDCHRDPAPHLRPREALFARDWTPLGTVEAMQLHEAYGIAGTGRLTDCDTCHF